MKTPVAIEPHPFTERFRALVTASGLTGAEFARRVGISTHSLHLYRRGYRIPSDRTLGRIAAACDVEPAWLRGEPGEPRSRGEGRA